MERKSSLWRSQGPVRIRTDPAHTLILSSFKIHFTDLKVILPYVPIHSTIKTIECVERDMNCMYSSMLLLRRSLETQSQVFARTQFTAIICHHKKCILITRTTCFSSHAIIKWDKIKCLSLQFNLRHATVEIYGDALTVDSKQSVFYLRLLLHYRRCAYNDTVSGRHLSKDVLLWTPVQSQVFIIRAVLHAISDCYWWTKGAHRGKVRCFDTCYCSGAYPVPYSVRTEDS
jgi:hypothetical protein